MLDTEFDVCVIGLGYIGLPTASIFASVGLKVAGVDINETVVTNINKKTLKTREPGLLELVNKVVSDRLFIASTTPQISQNYIIAVPTPVIAANNKPDMKYIFKAIEKILPILKTGDLIVIESTISIGTTENIAKFIKLERPDLQVPLRADDMAGLHITHCPERVLPGKILRELRDNDRVIGGITSSCCKKAQELYEKVVNGGISSTSHVRVAEMSKLVENSYRDVNIAFANEISMLSSRAGIDVWELRRIANLHPRVNLLEPGPGVGGHCIAIDPWFLVDFGGEDARLIETARNVNDKKQFFVLEKIEEKLVKLLNSDPNRTGSDICIAIYGLSYKPDVDDLRESPAVAITRELAQRNHVNIEIIEPNVERLPAQLSSDRIRKVSSSNADVHVILVDHASFYAHKFNPEVTLDFRGVLSNK